MIKLKAPLNYGGVFIEAGQVINYLPLELQKKLVENGVAEFIGAENVAGQDKAKTFGEITKDTAKAVMLEYAKLMNIEGINDKMTKAEIFERIKQAIGDGNDQLSGSNV
ncbi:MAG: hypothetical protein DIU64_003145 [Caldicoprobacter oshimai]